MSITSANPASAVSISRRGLPTRDTWLAALLFTTLTVLLAYPLSLHPSTLRFPSGPDGDLGWYLLAWDSHALVHHPWSIFEANIYYPQHLTLAYGENIIGIALFAAPVIWLTGNLVLAANLVSLLSGVLCGVGAYLLARRIRLSVAAALICGIIFECAPPRFYRIGQMPLASVQWIPFALAALHAYFHGGRLRDLRLAVAFTSLQVLSSGHGAMFIAVALLIFGVYRVLLGEPLRLVRRVQDLGVPGVLLLLPAILVYLPYRAVQHDVGLKRGLGSWGENYAAFFASPTHVHRFLASLVTGGDVNATASAFLFPGYLALVLALAAVVWRGRTSAVADREGIWTKVGLVIELAIVVTATTAAILTAGTLLPLEAGTAPLFDPRKGALAWTLCTCLAAVALALRRWLPPETVRRHRRRLAILLTAAVTWTLLSVARPTLHAADGLAAEYFANPEWGGPPAFSVVDARPSTAGMSQRWGGAPPDRFSAGWTGYLTVPRSGIYNLALSSDDGSELMIDGRLVIDNGGRHSLAMQSVNIHLARGSHPVLLRYVQFGGESALNWSWSHEGGAPSTVPGWLLSQRPTSYSTAIAARIMDWILWSLAIAAVLATASYLRIALRRRPEEAVARCADTFRRDMTGFYTVLTLVALALALGPPFGLWRYVYWLPGFTFIRANSRFTVLAVLGLAVLAGIGFDKISRGLAGRRRVLLVTTACVVLVAEYAAMPMAVQPNTLGEIPAIDRWLDSQAKPFVVAEVPVRTLDVMGAFERQEVAFMIHSTAHWQKTVHGYSGWRASLHWQLFSEMQHFPDEASITSLCDLGVTYVVVHSDLYQPGEWSDVEERLRQFSSRLRLEHVENGGRVYSLVRPREQTAPRT